MKIELVNGWVPTITDIDFMTCSDEELRFIGRMIPTNLVVVIRGQTLTPERQLYICNVWGDAQIYSKSATKMRIAKEFMIHDGVARVTGAKNEDGKPGVFGQKEELDWHANGVESIKDRENIVFLYAENGTAGSKTSWLNNSLSYKSLPDDIRDKVKTLEMYTKTPEQESESIRKAREEAGQQYWSRRSKKPKPVYYKNEFGAEGLYYPHLFADDFVGYEYEEQEKLKQFLTNHILQDKFIYDHEWQDGDIVVSEQNLSLHKRWHCDFIEDRLLWRSATNYRKILDA
jgi:taurine dioxygenase